MPTINLADIKTKSMLWVNRPEASSAKGEVFYFTDIGPNGSYWISNGEFWSPLNGEVTLFSSGLDVALTGTTTETALGTYTLPGGLMSRVGQIDVVGFMQHTTSANNKTVRVRLSDKNTITGVAHYTYVISAFTNTQFFCSIKSNNSINAQKSFGATSGTVAGIGSTASALITGSRDMSQQSDISITGELALGTESITLSGFYIVYRG